MHAPLSSPAPLAHPSLFSSLPLFSVSSSTPLALSLFLIHLCSSCLSIILRFSSTPFCHFFILYFFLVCSSCLSFILIFSSPASHALPLSCIFPLLILLPFLHVSFFLSSSSCPSFLFNFFSFFPCPSFILIFFLSCSSYPSFIFLISENETLPQ